MWRDVARGSGAPRQRCLAGFRRLDGVPTIPVLQITRRRPFAVVTRKILKQALNTLDRLMPLDFVVDNRGVIFRSYK